MDLVEGILMSHHIITTIQSHIIILEGTGITGTGMAIGLMVYEEYLGIRSNGLLSKYLL
jgi:hypothetical protein